MVAATVFRCLWLWQPERQLQLHQEHLRRALEGRDWGKVEALIDPGYADRWGYTRPAALHDARQWLGQFFALTIVAEPAGHQLSAGGGTVTERWKLDGNGLEGAMMVKRGVNELETPFVFQWKHAGWKPWAWTLIRVDNPGLQLSPSGM